MLLEKRLIDRYERINVWEEIRGIFYLGNYGYGLF